ncbi:hypothetical protein DICA0_E19790 [Diutina catenulata]
MSVEAPPPAHEVRLESGPSKYTIHDLLVLANPATSYTSRLACVGFIDQNAFYAQVEQHRLQLDRKAPVVCAQWNSLIAVSYAARAYGINRMDSIDSARRKCPGLVAAHAAVYKKGESHWAYIDDGELRKQQHLYKVSLDPYRRESRKIIGVLASQCPVVQKASVDESFVDLGPMVVDELVRRGWVDLKQDAGTSLPDVKSLVGGFKEGKSLVGGSEEGKGGMGSGGDTDKGTGDGEDTNMSVGDGKDTDTGIGNRNNGGKPSGGHRDTDNGGEATENGGEASESGGEDSGTSNAHTNPSKNSKGPNSDSKPDPSGPSKPLVDAHPFSRGFIGETLQHNTVSDWDELVLLLGSQMVFRLRQLIESELGYLTSGGVAHNKVLAKLAGGFRKPDNQVVVLKATTPRFLANFKLTDIPGMGGIEGKDTVAKLSIPPTESDPIGYIRANYDLDHLRAVLSDDRAASVYDMVHGTLTQPIKTQTAVKQMLSRKNLASKAIVNTLGDAFDWLRVFVADLINRIGELDDENPHSKSVYRPKTISITLNLYSINSGMSRQTKMPLVVPLDRLRSAMESVGTRVMCDAFASVCDMEKLNHGKPTKELFKDLSQFRYVKTCDLMGMGCTVSNFVEVASDSMLDRLSTASNSDRDYRARMFEEANTTNVGHNPRSHEAKSRHMRPTGVTAVPKPDKQYLKRLFSEVESTPPAMRHHLPHASHKKHTSPDILSQLRAGSSGRADPSRPHPRADKNPLGDDSDDNWREKVNEGYCTRCKEPVTDASAHLDYHVALELDAQLNAPR